MSDLETDFKTARLSEGFDEVAGPPASASPLACHRHPPAAIDRHEAQEDARARAGQHRVARWRVERVSERDDGATGERRDRVELAGRQDERDITGQDIARHPAADAGEHA